MGILDMSKKTGDSIIVAYNDSPQDVGTPALVDYSGSVSQISADVDILRRQYDDDPDGLFASLEPQQLGFSYNTTNGYTTMIYKDALGVRHDYVETSALIYWADGNAGFIKPADNKGLELFAELISTSSASFTSVELTSDQSGSGDNATKKSYVDELISGLSSVYLGISATAKDSEKLGGQFPSDYATASSLGDYVLKSGDTMTGKLIINNSVNGDELRIGYGSDSGFNPYISLYTGTTTRGLLRSYDTAQTIGTFSATNPTKLYSYNVAVVQAVNDVILHSDNGGIRTDNVLFVQRQNSDEQARFGLFRTGNPYISFYHNETRRGYMMAMGGDQYGLTTPTKLYSDNGLILQTSSSNKTKVIADYNANFMVDTISSSTSYYAGMFFQKANVIKYGIYTYGTDTLFRNYATGGKTIFKDCDVQIENNLIFTDDDKYIIPSFDQETSGWSYNSTYINSFAMSDLRRYNDSTLHISFEIFTSTTSRDGGVITAIIWKSGNIWNLVGDKVYPIEAVGTASKATYGALGLGIRYNTANSRTEFCHVGGNLSSSTQFRVNKILAV